MIEPPHQGDTNVTRYNALNATRYNALTYTCTRTHGAAALHEPARARHRVACARAAGASRATPLDIKLVGAAEMTFSLRYVRASCLPPPSSRPDHVSKRSEALWHASADAHSACVPSATVCLLVRTHLDECRVPNPEASTRPSPARLSRCLGSAEWIGGGEAWIFQGGDAVCAPRLAPRRRFAA